MITAAQNNRQWISSEIGRLRQYLAVKETRVRELEDALASLDNPETGAVGEPIGPEDGQPNE